MAQNRLPRMMRCWEGSTIDTHGRLGLKTNPSAFESLLKENVKVSLSGAMRFRTPPLETSHSNFVLTSGSQSAHNQTDPHSLSLNLSHK